MTSEITLDQLLSHLEYMNKRGVDKLNIEDVIAMIKMIRLTDESLLDETL